MRRIMSAPANIANMVNRIKQPKKLNINKSDHIIKSEINSNNKNYIIVYRIKKDIVNNKKKIKNTLSGIISDSFIETNKYIPNTDTYLLNYIIEFINNFINNKFNRKNFENFIISLLVRFFASQIYHDLIIKIKENIHLNK